MYWRHTLTIVLRDLDFVLRDLDFVLRDLDFFLLDLDFVPLGSGSADSSPAGPTHTLHSARRTVGPCPPQERVGLAGLSPSGLRTPAPPDPRCWSAMCWPGSGEAGVHGPAPEGVTDQRLAICVAPFLS